MLIYSLKLLSKDVILEDAWFALLGDGKNSTLADVELHEPRR